MQDVFRRHFEARFQPLPAGKSNEPDVTVEDAEKDTSDEDEDEWSGCSSDGGVEVVEHADDPAAFEAPAHDKRQLRAFMVRPPLPTHAAR